MKAASAPTHAARLAAAVLALAGLGGLSGCAEHNLSAPSVAVPAAFRAGPEMGGKAAAPAAALDAWWRLFPDPQLSTLIEQALVSAPDARQALAVLAEARANRAAALTRFDPQGSISGTVTRQHSDVSGIGGVLQTGGAGTSTTYTGAFDPSWEIDLFGRRRAAEIAADADLAAARFVYEGSRQSLAAAVATNLFEARSTAAQIEQAREAVRIAHDLAAIGKRRATLGLGSSADAASLAADLATAESTLRADEAQLAISKRSLLVLIGRGTEPLDALAIEPKLDEPPELPRTTPGELLRRRPDLREAEARVQSAAGNLKLDELALFPTFNLLPGVSATLLEGPLGYSSKVWSLAAGMMIPVLDRPRLMDEIEAATARGEQAVIAYEKAVQTAYGEAENGLTQIASDRMRLTNLSDAEEQSRLAFEARRTGYRNGVVDLTTLLDAERSWRTNRSALIALQGAALIDDVNTFKALGGGWNPTQVAAGGTLVSQVKP